MFFEYIVMFILTACVSHSHMKMLFFIYKMQWISDGKNERKKVKEIEEEEEVISV